MDRVVVQRTFLTCIAATKPRRSRSLPARGRCDCDDEDVVYEFTDAGIWNKFEVSSDFSLGQPVPTPPGQAAGCDGFASLILRNIANSDRDNILQYFAAAGVLPLVNFFYLPVKISKSHVLGYAVVNCTSQAATSQFEAFINQFAAAGLGMPKITAERSGIYGCLGDMIERWRNSSLMHPGVPDMFKPVLLRDGVRIAFPDPTVTLPPPVQPLAGGLMMPPKRLRVRKAIANSHTVTA